MLDDGYSAVDLKRPGISEVLDLLEGGGSDVLVVAKLDRLSRSLLDFASLMAVPAARDERSSPWIWAWTPRRPAAR